MNLWQVFGEKLTMTMRRGYSYRSDIAHFSIRQNSLQRLLFYSRVAYNFEKTTGINRHYCFHLELRAAFNNPSGENHVKWTKSKLLPILKSLATEIHIFFYMTIHEPFAENSQIGACRPSRL